jgi:hypothetical protein
MSVTRVQLVGNVSTGASFAGIITSTSIVVSAGTTSAPSISPSGDSNTGIFFPSADTIAASTNGTGRLFINNGGDIGVGTASPVSRLHVTGGDSVFGSGNLTRILNAEQVIDFANAAQDTYVAGRINGLNLKFYTNTGSGIDITSAGLVGINTTSPDSTLTVNGTARVQSAASFAGINIQNSNDSSVSTTTSFLDTSNNLGTIDGHIFFEHLTTGGSNAIIATTPAGDRAVDRRVSRLSISFAGTTTLNSATSTAPFIAQIAGTERARIDSSGRLLVGTSTSVWDSLVEVARVGGAQFTGHRYGANAFPAEFNFLKSRGASVGTNTILADGDTIANINFRCADGSSYIACAQISAEVDGTPGTNDMPGRIVLATTADGAASPTERLRITSAGLMGLGTSAPAQRLHLSHPTSGGTTSLLVSNPDGAAGAAAGIKLGVSPEDNSVAKFAILHERFYTYGRGDTYFCSNFADDTTEVTDADAVITIKGDTKTVGIGITSPQAILSVSDGTVTGEINPYSASSTCFFGTRTNHSVSFQINASEKARIDTSGRLLIGTSTSTNNNRLSQKLSVVNTGDNTYGGISLTSYVGTTAQDRASIIDLQRSRGTTDGVLTSVVSGDALGYIIFRGSDGSAFQDSSIIQSVVEGTPAAGKIASRLVFSTTLDGASSPTERMRIGNDGTLTCQVSGATRMLIDGTNGGSTHFSCTGLTGVDNAPNAEGGIVHQSNGNTKVRGVATNNTLFQWYYYNNTSSSVGNITVAVSSTSYNTSSDYRLKENVVDLDGAIARLNQLPVHRFNFIVDPDTVVDGFIAHEAAEVVPECVTGTKDEVDDNGNPVYQGIDQSKLVPLLTAALQEAIGEIESLKARVAALESA